MSKALVIVESPTKAKTISKFLGKNYVVESSLGHIRDLPRSASEIPPAIKSEPWGRIAIDVEGDFVPYYVIPAEKKKQVAKLKELLKGADMLYLATDEDREGESISWHLCEVLKPKVPKKRLVFHEITRDAIKASIDSPRDIDERLVRAQETRRILDRLFGYEVSPVLWRKIAPRLSAGRVQSVAVRMIVDRERARMAFVPASYWDLSAAFDSMDGDASGFPLRAGLISVGGKRVASGRDFDDKGRLKSDPNDVARLDERAARELIERLKGADFEVTRVERKPYALKPGAPFTTSTLQQEANRKLRLSTRVTMQLAQRLYENGYITYMRTDSTNLAEQAVTQLRDLVRELYGREYLPAEARRFQTRVKNAQEAHEAIRPAGEQFRRPDELKDEVNPDELRLYELIWKRTVACQMEEARGHRVIVHIEGGGAVFQASGKTIEFPGFLRAYVEGADDPEAEIADQETVLPSVEVGQRLRLADLEPKGHETQPPPRFTEASLVKELEANGVGRPSTYSSIIDTILRREYVTKQGSALVPTFTAFAVVELLKKNFTDLVEVGYTARMEDDLDAISRGEQDPLPYLKGFYFGGGGITGLKKLLEADIDPRESCTIPLGTDAEGRAINVRIGRYGPYLERGDERASIPEGLAPDALDIAKATKLLEQGSGPVLLGQCPKTRKPVYLRSGRYGPYIQLGEPDEKLKQKSLLPGMNPETLTLEQALQVLSLPRSLGVDPETGEEVFADYGRYGPYLKRGSENRSFQAPDEVLTIRLERAIEIFKTQRGRGGSRASAVLRDLGKDVDSGRAIVLMNGRFGPYVTDGEINANVPRGASLDDLSLTEALALLKARAQRRADGGGPARRGWRKRSPAADRKPAAEPAAKPAKAAKKKKRTVKKR